MTPEYIANLYKKEMIIRLIKDKPLIGYSKFSLPYILNFGPCNFGTYQVRECLFEDGWIVFENFSKHFPARIIDTSIIVPPFNLKDKFRLKALLATLSNV